MYKLMIKMKPLKSENLVTAETLLKVALAGVQEVMLFIGAHY